ncbi:MAG: hypothetical protein M1826_007058 [Phylliscum demangeonii]|nr:MAG: hypothetical protein M1826_007058 [Phylliscum demangeonii]
MPSYFYHLSFEIDPSATHQAHEGQTAATDQTPSTSFTPLNPSLKATDDRRAGPRPPPAESKPSSTRDWRWDRISVDSIDLAPTTASAMLGPPAAVASSGARRHRGGGPNTIEAGADAVAAKARYVPLDPHHAELGWGIVHLYRDGEESPALADAGGVGLGKKVPRRMAGAGAGRGSASTANDSMDLSRRQAITDDDCTTVAILAVPSYLTPSDFLGFVGERAMKEVSHVRMIRTERVNRYMVLMKFRDARRAREWQKEWNGKTFSSIDPEYCHVVFIKSIQFQPAGPDVDHPSTFPNLKNDPLRPQTAAAAAGRRSDEAGRSSSQYAAAASLSTKPVAPPTPSLVELPTCPVCLERMDDTTGLLTILCQHVFHCACLQRWRGSGCPVCRYTQDHAHAGVGLGAILPGHDGGGAAAGDDRRCRGCDGTTNLWICLICGHLGCGRYDAAHAFSHYAASAHRYAMDIETQRVWDYAGDGYVHRLMQDRSDGKLVMLPSALAHLVLDEAEADAQAETGAERERLSTTAATDDRAADYVPRQKLDHIGMEYTYLLTSQLESQRQYFEEQVAQAADKARRAALHADEHEASARRAAADLARLHAAHHAVTHETVPALERDQARLAAGQERAAALARRMQHEWRQEKALSDSLLAKVTDLQAEVARLAEGEGGEEGGDGEDIREGVVSIGPAPDPLAEEAKGKGKGKGQGKGKGKGRR